jgi:chromosome segregation ATPase
MTNAETRWEGAVLDKLTNNGEGIAVVENKLDYLTENVSGLKQDVSGLKQDFSQLQQEVSGFKQDISQLQQDVSEIKSVLRWLKRIGIGTLTIVSMIAIGLITNAVWEFVRPV